MAEGTHGICEISHITPLHHIRANGTTVLFSIPSAVVAAAAGSHGDPTAYIHVHLPRMSFFLLSLLFSFCLFLFWELAEEYLLSISRCMQIEVDREVETSKLD